MGKVINCECGEVVRAETDNELVQKVERHVGQAHPELVGKLSREDVLGDGRGGLGLRSGRRPRRPLASRPCICALSACAASSRFRTRSS